MSIEVTPPAFTGPILFPLDVVDSHTAVVLNAEGPFLPVVAWLGTGREFTPGAGRAAGILAAAGDVVAPVLLEHWRSVNVRPGLRGYRLQPEVPGHSTAAWPASGRAWSTQFRTSAIDVQGSELTIRATDPAAGLAVQTQIQTVVGGALRIRHILTNTGESPYVIEGLEVTVPVPDIHSEIMDFTGRHERERYPQRHPISDGLWLREGYQGRTGLDASQMIVTGPAGFGFTDSSVVAVHVAWSGNTALRVERSGATGTTIGGGEHLLPGEMCLDRAESYATPWVHIVASDDGLDGVAAAFHQWLRTAPAHPELAPVTLNVWEAVYFDHDLDRLKQLADRAAQVGVERFVLDDGWFHGRRDDTAGLGDWWVDPAVWPDGLTPLIEYVRGRGMEFGLWLEPEMVNPDSDLYRAHPDWVLATGDREPLLERCQLVLDLSRPEVWDHIFGQLDKVLAGNDISYVKWDHNRDLLDAGSALTAGAPAVHQQTLAFYRLLDALREAHPTVAWESCASGGGRIDLGVLDRVERVWTSDMTEALARQSIQRWTTQLVAPEYLGAHVSAPRSHQSDRVLSLDFRAGTALFGAFGIEWDVTTATDPELAQLKLWVALYKRFRSLIHTGRVVRVETADPAVWVHGVIAQDRSEALMAHVQLDESAHSRGMKMRVPGLRPDEQYNLAWVGPVDPRAVSRSPAVSLIGPTSGVSVTGDVLGGQGVWIPRRRPESILLTHLTIDDGGAEQEELIA